MSQQQGDYGNLIHGVSQQPDERLAKGQVREQINCRSHLTKGLSSRAAFLYIGELVPDEANQGQLNNAKWISQQRGDGNDFIVAYDSSRPAVFNLLAQRQNFTFHGDSALYYKNALVNPKQELGVDSILDTTFITNRNVVPVGHHHLDTIADPTRVTWIEWKTFQAGTKIKVTLGAITYETQVFEGFATVDPSTGVPSPADTVRAEEYEGSHHALAFATLAASVDVTQYNNWVRIQAPTTDIVRIELGGESIQIHENKSIDSVEVLPPFAVEGDVCKIDKVKDDEKALGYFTAVSRNTEGLDFAEVAWDETIAPTSSGWFNDDTMPHQMTRDLANNFVLTAIPWASRQTGDSETNPYPSFIKNKAPITNVGVFQNRMFLTSNEIVFLSASDSFFDLWRESAFYNTDADPFEAFADTNELNIIKYAEEMDGDLVFFSDNGQFLLSGKIAHTYNTASISSVSQFKTDFRADPVLSGDNIFFATDSGNYAGVRELYTDGTDRTKRALPITEHVDEYIFGNINHMSSSTNLDALCSLSTTEPDTCFVYEWKRDSQGSLKQGAWHKWLLGADQEFEWVGFIDAKLYAVVAVLEFESVTGPTYQLWNLDWDDAQINTVLEFPVLLDGRFLVRQADITYDSGTDTSTWTTPYDRADLVFVELLNSEDAGFQVSATRVDKNVWTALGDLSNMTLYGGMKFTSVVELPNPQMKDREGVSKGIERLQLGKLYVHFSKVGKMRMTLSDTHGRKREVDYINRRVNHLNNQASLITDDPSTWEIGVRKKTKNLTMTFTTDDIVPFVIRAIEWRGEFRQIGRRS